MLPYFYHPGLESNPAVVTLDEPTSKHVIQVLRMEEGEHLLLTNGRGVKARGTIMTAERKRCAVKMDSVETAAPRPVKITLAISFTKNNSRNEWLLEKITEMGIDRIIPLAAARTEKEKFNAQRLQGILVSAMLQSQQAFLPELTEPMSLKKIESLLADCPQRLIAHCLEEETRTSLLQTMNAGENTVVLIGPEGDFTKVEIDLSLQKGFRAVSLGPNRLRTETAGLYACTLFNALNYA